MVAAPARIVHACVRAVSVRVRSARARAPRQRTLTPGAFFFFFFFARFFQPGSEALKGGAPAAALAAGAVAVAAVAVAAAAAVPAASAAAAEEAVAAAVPALLEPPARDCPGASATVPACTCAQIAWASHVRRLVARGAAQARGNTPWLSCVCVVCALSIVQVRQAATPT